MSGDARDILAEAEYQTRLAHDVIKGIRPLEPLERLERLRDAHARLLQAVKVVESGLALAEQISRMTGVPL